MRTTININKDLLIKLKTTSEDLKVSTNDLIAIMINTVAVKNIFKVKTYTAVRYQNPGIKNNWKKLHIKFEPQVYEKSLDLRKCFKLSVSLIISFAISHFLDEIVEEIKNSNKNDKMMDNYPLNYTFIANVFDGIQGFIVFWGIPEKKIVENLIT